MPDPVDATSEFSDVNAYDRIYRCTGGCLAKVRVEDNSPLPTVMSVKVTGAWADDQGKARVFDAGHFIIEPIEVPIRPDSATDPAQLIEEARVTMAQMVCEAVANHQTIQALGVKPKAIASMTDPPPIPDFGQPLVSLPDPAPTPEPD